MGLELIILIIFWVLLFYLIVGPDLPDLVEQFSFVGLLGISAALVYLFAVRVLDWNPNPLRVDIARILTYDREIYLGDVVPGLYDLDDIRRIDADGENTPADPEEGDQWLAFYRYDVVSRENAAPGGPYGAAIYEPDGCRPPSLLAFELVPASYDYLGQDAVEVLVDNIIKYEDPLSDGRDRPEVIITGRTREVVTDLNIFRKVGIKQDQCLPWRRDASYPAALQLTSPFSYENIGSFRGSYKVVLSKGKGDLSTVNVWDSGGFERSQLTIRKQYRPGENGSYFRSGTQELWDPVEYSLDFGPGEPDQVPQVYYPEKAVLAFYLNLTKDKSLLEEAKTYLSPRAQATYDMRTDPFGLSTAPDSVARARGDLARVLVLEIGYEADTVAEQQHLERTVEVTVVGVNKNGRIDDEQHRCRVTWQIVGISNPAARPYGCEWRLDSYVSSCQPQ